METGMCRACVVLLMGILEPRSVECDYGSPVGTVICQKNITSLEL